MPNYVQYSTTNLTGSLRKGNVALGVTTASIAGPTSTTNWYSGITPAAGKYVIYKTAASGDPDIFCPQTNQELYAQDERIFQNFFQYRNKNIVVLNSGMGDHIVFNSILPEIHNPVVFSCYPEIVPGQSIAAAQALFGDLDQWNIYAKMDQWKWKDSLENAFRKLYL